jgi:hypothetical protein
VCTSFPSAYSPDIRSRAHCRELPSARPSLLQLQVSPNHPRRILCPRPRAAAPLTRSREPGHESTQCPQPRSTDGKQCYACGGVGMSNRFLLARRRLLALFAHIQATSSWTAPRFEVTVDPKASAPSPATSAAESVTLLVSAEAALEDSEADSLPEVALPVDPEPPSTRTVLLSLASEPGHSTSEGRAKC